MACTKGASAGRANLPDKPPGRETIRREVRLPRDSLKGAMSTEDLEGSPEAARNREPRHGGATRQTAEAGEGGSAEKAPRPTTHRAREPGASDEGHEEEATLQNKQRQN